MNDEDTPIVKRKPRGRGLGYKHSEVARSRIRTMYLINRLGKCVSGEIELSATQLRAAEILLRKALPDLSQVEHKGMIEHRNVTDLTDAELIAIAASRSHGTAEAEGGEGVPATVHRIQ